MDAASAFDQQTQEALKTRIRAINEPDVRASLQLYAIAREQLYAAAEGGSKYAITLALSMGRDGGWGIPGELRRSGWDINSHRTFLEMRNRNPYKVPTQADFNCAYDLMSSGDFTFYEAMCRFGTFIRSEQMKTLVELGSPRAITCYYKLIPKKYLTGMSADVLCRYVNADVRGRIFDVYDVLVTAEHSLRVLVCVNQSEIEHAVEQYNMFARRVLERIRAKFRSMFTPSKVCELIDYMRGGFGCVDCIELYATRTERYRAAAICWLLCARKLMCRDTAAIIGRMVYNGRFPL